jgi:Recombination endonuclease VII
MNERTRYATNTEYYKRRDLRKRGMPDSEIDKAIAAWAKFSGICDACCGTECAETKRGLKWVTDHDSLTGRFRGIVGNSCNLGMGYFNHDRLTMLRIERYLSKRV